MTVSWSLSDDNTIYLVKSEEKIENADDINIIDKVGFGAACFYEGNPAVKSSLNQKALNVKNLAWIQMIIAKILK